MKKLIVVLFLLTSFLGFGQSVSAPDSKSFTQSTSGQDASGFVLNGYPSSGYSVGAMWDGSTYATINPLGQFLGAIIMFGVLGMLPGYIIARVLSGMGKLRIPREVEIAGLDYEMMESAKEDEKAVSSATR